MEKPERTFLVEDKPKKIELTIKNIHENEEFLAENAGELTPHQIKDVKEHLASKKKHIEEMDGTIK